MYTKNITIMYKEIGSIYTRVPQIFRWRANLQQSFSSNPDQTHLPVIF